ncbi:MAG: 50S ribosomal protein L24 [Chromatiales bacterium]|jgi:large subunit ribosomal protein L24|nr:MAG: 50S ribosomal protein L24 [Chromatiales bacterium]
MKRIRKNDQVIVIAGRDKGRKGAVTRVDGDRVWVENINVVKRHQKPNPAKGLQGGIVEKEMSLHESNVALLNTTTDKADRVGFRMLEDGRKVRYFKSNKEVVDV